MPADVLTKGMNEVTWNSCGSCRTLPDNKFVSPPRCWKKDGKLVNGNYCHPKNTDEQARSLGLRPRGSTSGALDSRPKLGSSTSWLHVRSFSFPPEALDPSLKTHSQRPMRFVHAAFSSGLETFVEQPNSCYNVFCAPFNSVCIFVVHVRHVCELGFAEQRWRHSKRTIWSQHDGVWRRHNSPFQRRVHYGAPHPVAHDVAHGVSDAIRWALPPLGTNIWTLISSLWNWWCSVFLKCMRLWRPARQGQRKTARAYGHFLYLSLSCALYISLFCPSLLPFLPSFSPFLPFLRFLYFSLSCSWTFSISSWAGVGCNWVFQLFATVSRCFRWLTDALLTIFCALNFWRPHLSQDTTRTRQHATWHTTTTRAGLGHTDWKSGCVEIRFSSETPLCGRYDCAVQFWPSPKKTNNSTASTRLKTFLTNWENPNRIPNGLFTCSGFMGWGHGSVTFIEQHKCGYRRTLVICPKSNRRDRDVK